MRTVFTFPCYFTFLLVLHHYHNPIILLMHAHSQLHICTDTFTACNRDGQTGQKTVCVCVCLPLSEANIFVCCSLASVTPPSGSLFLRVFLRGHVLRRCVVVLCLETTFFFLSFLPPRLTDALIFFLYSRAFSLTTSERYIDER